MRRTFCIVVGLVVLGLAGCGSSKPQDLIIGKWEHTIHFKPGEGKPEIAWTRTLEFLKDGTIQGNRVATGGKDSMTPEGAFKGKWKLNDDGKTIDVEFGETGSEKLKVESVTRSELVTIDAKGQKVIFTRM